MEQNFELNVLDKAAIVSIAIVVLLVVLAITACLVVPGCLGYACLHKKVKETDEMVMIQRAKKKFSIISIDNHSPLYQSGSHIKTMETQDGYQNASRSLFNGNYAPMTFLPVEMVDKPSTLKVLFSYSDLQDVTDLGRLLIKIIAAENIPSRDYPVLPDTSVKVEIVPKRFSLTRHDKPVHELQSRLIRSSKSPVFDQSFVVAAGKADLKTWVLRISVMDEDRLTRCRAICRTKIHLREMKNLSSVEVPLELNLEPVVYDYGQLLIALSYLPTSQRLSASVIKANKLAWNSLVNDVAEFRPCVKVTLLDHGGKVLKKKKIWGDFGMESPAFNGSICFQISPIAYETATLVCVVSSEKEVTGQSYEETKKSDVLGYAALGWLVKEESGRDHWRAVLQTPRKIISQWHTLR